MEIINPADKPGPKLTEGMVEQAIKELNRSNYYPIIINIGKHLMNSYTQEYIEKMVRDCGYYRVTRRLERNGRFEVLEVDYKHNPTIEHKLN